MEVPLGEGPQVLVQPFVGREPEHLVRGFDLDLALLLDVPFRRRRFLGRSGRGSRRGGISRRRSCFPRSLSHPGRRVPASSKGNLSQLRLLDFYRGGRLIASPCCADNIGLP